MEFSLQNIYLFRFTNQLKYSKKPLCSVCSILPQANRMLLRDTRLEQCAATCLHNTAASDRVCHSVYCLHYSYFTNPTAITNSVDVITQFIALNSRHFLPKNLILHEKMNLHADISHTTHGTNFIVSFRFASMAVIRPFLEYTRSEGFMLVAGPTAPALRVSMDVTPQ